MPHAWRLLISLAAVVQQGGGWWLTGNSSNRTEASEPRHQDVSGSRVDRRPCHVVPPDLPGLTCRDSGLCMVLDCCQLHRLDALRQLLARRQDGVPAHLQTLALLVLCMGAHYLWALCWPALSLFCAVVMGLIWMLRATIRSRRGSRGLRRRVPGARDREDPGNSRPQALQENGGRRQMGSCTS